MHIQIFGDDSPLPQEHEERSLLGQTPYLSIHPRTAASPRPKYFHNRLAHPRITPRISPTLISFRSEGLGSLGMPKTLRATLVL